MILETNVENMQMKTQRAETLLIRNRKKPKILTIHTLMGVLVSIVALVNHYKKKSERTYSNHL
jgi:hypothetical protein